MLVSGYNGLGVSFMASIEKAVSILQRLSAEKLEVALYLLELLALKEELEATEEVARDPELAEMISRARSARQEGRAEEFVPWEARHGV
ncbi:MAG: hypothetical protein ACUVSP_10765 [Desulfotomaculales bacterium]